MPSKTYPNATCPDCGKSLVLRNGPFGPFYGCSGFPACTVTAKVEQVETENPDPIDSAGTKELRTTVRRMFDKLMEERHCNYIFALTMAGKEVDIDLDPDIASWDRDTLIAVLNWWLSIPTLRQPKTRRRKT